MHWKDWCWNWSSNTLATWWEELTHWKRPWCWERLRAGERVNRGWEGWMAWVYANSGTQWRTGKPDTLQFMGCKASDTTERLKNSYYVLHMLSCAEHIRWGRNIQKANECEQERKVTTNKCDTITAFESSIQRLQNSFTFGNGDSGKVNDMHCIFSWVLRCRERKKEKVNTTHWSLKPLSPVIPEARYTLS